MKASMESSDHKARLRELLRRRRAELTPAAAAQAAQKIAEIAMAELPALCAPGAKIALYAALPGELDPGLLLAALAEAGYATLLPSAGARATPLTFRIWRPGDELATGRFGLREPLASAEAARPDLVLAPLLGFDSAGGRLGFGGGFYDATLEKLRRQGALLAGGLAFACQQLDQLRCEAHDQKLDFIITEQAFRRF